MDISGNNNNRTGTLIVVQRKNYLTPIIESRFHDSSRSYYSHPSQFSIPNRFVHFRDHINHL